MFKHKLTIGAFMCLLTLNSFSQKVVGYFDASLNQAGTRIQNIDFTKMTDFIYGFVQPDASGNLPDPTTLSHFNTCKTKCANAGVKFHFSSGGATYSSIFNQIGASQVSIDNFASEIADLLQAQGMDGFDLDWEFPTTGTAQTYQTNILKAIHDEFTARGKRADWKIAIAVGGETPSVGSQGVYHTDYCSPNSFQYLDFLNIMSYDIGYNISGGDYNHSSYADAENNIDDWVAAGCPVEKITLGVPFYARHQTNRGASVYADAYSDLSSGNPSAAYNSDNVGTKYYNGKTTLENKVDLIQSKGGNGIMIWEITYDRTDQYSLLGAIADQMAQYQCGAPTPDLGNDQSICGVGSITLDGGIAQASGRTFTWKQGNTTLVNQSSTATTYNATSAGTYTLEVWESGCNRSDEIEITGTLNAMDLGGPYDLCSPVSVSLASGVNPTGKTIEWQKNNVTISGETGANYTAKTAGTFKVIVSASGCSSVNASATVTSSVPSADNDTVCNAGEQASITASESVNWYSSEVSSTILSTGTNYTPTVNSNTTYWIEGSGSSSTPYTTMKSAFAGGWLANPQVYANKLIVATEISIDKVTVNSAGGSTTINLVASDGTTVVKTKTFGSVTGETELDLSWTSIPAGTYYLNAVGTSANLWVDNSLDGSDYVVANVITVEKACYNDWSAPYGDGYVVSSNYGNFFNLKITAGSSCDRVPVDVVINSNNPSCLTTGLYGLGKNHSRVYPNPSYGQFTIESNIGSIITILDSKGAVVDVFTLTESNFQFGSELESGIYFIKVVNGSILDSHRVVKTK